MLALPAAHRIPEEVFADIIYFIYDWTSADPLDFTKRQLGQCSLTCRYWARETRPHIFGCIKLQSRDDALTFVALAKCNLWPAHSILPIGKYLLGLQLEVVGMQSLPWIHLILHFMPADLLGNTSDSTIGLCMKFSGAKQDGDVLEPAPPHVYHGLPRRLPLSHQSGFQRLQFDKIVVQDMIFNRPGDVLSFVNSITHGSSPTTSHVDLCRIRWNDTDPLARIIIGPPIQRLITRSLVSLSMERSPAILPLTKLLLACKVAKCSSPPRNLAQTYDNMASGFRILSVLQRCIFNWPRQIGDELSEENIQKNSEVEFRGWYFHFVGSILTLT